MFESFFYKVGRYVKKNKKKVLVFWIILFLLMAYPATLIFSDTSYNLTNSLVTKNSQSSKANDILSAQFNGSSSDPSIIIVSNNTPIDNLTISRDMMAFQHSMDSYLKSINVGYNSTTSIFTVENKTLMGYSNSTYKLENGTSGLIEYTLLLKEQGYNESYAITNITRTSPEHSTFDDLLGELNLTHGNGVPDFVSYVYNDISAPNNYTGIENYVVSLVNSSQIYLINNAKPLANPLIQINTPYYSNYLYSLYNNSGKKYSAFVSNIINNTTYNKFPVLPSSYGSSSLMNQKNSTLIMIFSYKTNITAAQQSHINSIEKTYSSKISSSSFYLAGSTVANNQLATESLHGMIVALIIGIIVSIIIVGLFFRSPVTAFLPFLIFVFSAVISAGINGLLYKYIFHTTISFITPTLLLILILGIASDYSVYILSRFRSELRAKNKDAIPESAKWAGHAVFTSGTTVALSYIILWISNIPIFSDAGLTNAIAAVVTIIIANTLLIAILAQWGKKTYWPAKIKENQKLPFEKSMEKVAHVALNNRKKIIVIFVIVALGALFLYSTTPTNMDVFELIPASSGVQATSVINSSLGYDLFDPAYVMVNFTSPIMTVNNTTGAITFNSTEYNQTLAMEDKLAASPYVHSISGPGYPYEKKVNYTDLVSSLVYSSQYLNQTATYIGHNHKSVEIVVYLSNVAWSNPSTNYVNKMPSIVNGSGNYTAYVGGTTEYLNNAYSFTSHSFNNMVPLLGITIFIILLIQLASALTPVRLILMVMAAVMLALSLTYIIFYYLLHLPVIIFLPLFVFITLLAVGLDYDIFMITKVQENISKGMNTAEAVKDSIVENGGVIITLGLLLFATFGALYFSGLGIIEEIGVGLALGVLIDTFVSWMFFVPAIMTVMDKYNWWPSRIGKDLPKEK
ncbi:MMPL family transporter [Ferroplasma acidiphilum]|uniref:MMPL family protein n=1 Tax=Ferroplasma acidiphilum TaxID=74969 RepID=A0A1V0N2H1_9ARCH|nr:MMPL family transporter [Ferroplasma acidiphilum]ARD84323.1 MMPL family protein [Ferroplasma acidiphilum]NOL60202.1 MMPL family transporter [Ferroplasma acidiphilum]WMT53240.1 MAG: MMPL family transporter [Ferroplasma acidiphilum]